MCFRQGKDMCSLKFEMCKASGTTVANAFTLSGAAGTPVGDADIGVSLAHKNVAKNGTDVFSQVQGPNLVAYLYYFYFTLSSITKKRKKIDLKN